MTNKVTFKESALLAIPLMLSSLSGLLMITVDRIMLSHYDIMVMNAVAISGLLIFAFEVAFSAITSMSEVMAGQFNGSGQYHKTPTSTWQMLMLSASSIVFLIPVGWFIGPYIIPAEFLEYSHDFFKILMTSLFLSSGFSAVSGFFIGTKQSKIVAIASIISNVLNITLNYFFIFGIDGYLDPMGSKGAAIGTSISWLVQFLIVFGAFLSKKQHEKYNTRKWRFDLKIMMTTLKVGIPSAISYVLHILGGYAIILIVVDTSTDLVTMHSICMNILIFMFFTSEGIQKSVVAMGSNLLGARRYEALNSLLYVSILMEFIAMLFLAIPILFFADQVIALYTTDPGLTATIKAALIWVIVLHFIEGCAWVFGYLLIAGGDTKFTSIADICGVWMLRVLPLYFLHKYHGLTVNLIWQISSISAFIMIFVFIYRLKYAKWHKIEV
jgi:MATE family multidrug resistance protein